MYGDPANLVNNAPVNANSLRYQYGTYPGMGSVDQYMPDLYAKTLGYNALQMQVAAPPEQGVADGGLAYTLAKGVGYQGYDPYTDETGRRSSNAGWVLGTEHRTTGGTTTRTANYSYDIPSFTDGARREALPERLAGLRRLRGC